MHELPITESILEITQRHARSAGAQRVTDIYLVIGRLSSVVGESVQFYWDMISSGTLAEGARLHFRRLEPELHCQGCGHDFSPGGNDFSCPACGGAKVRVVKGNEFYVEAIEVDAAATQDVQA